MTDKSQISGVQLVAEHLSGTYQRDPKMYEISWNMYDICYLSRYIQKYLDTSDIYQDIFKD